MNPERAIITENYDEWARYFETGDVTELMHCYIGLAANLANRYRAIHQEYDDAFNSAWTGIWSGITSFDPFGGASSLTHLHNCGFRRLMDHQRSILSIRAFRARKRGRPFPAMMPIGYVSLDLSYRWNIDNQLDGKAIWERLQPILGDRNAYIVRERMQGRTLEEIGGELRLSRERIRQLYDRSILTVREYYCPSA